MKWSIDIECTPEEARRFIGLPDVAEMQSTVIKQMQDRMQEHLNSSNPEDLMKMWMPGGMQGFTDLQKMVWDQMNMMSGQSFFIMLVITSILYTLI